MRISLPDAIERYFHVNDDVEALSGCFSDAAVVQDEGRRYQGVEAISAWFKQTRSEYQYISTPQRYTQQDDHHIVNCEVVGNFPGSPIHLQYHFNLQNDLINRLEITL